MSVVVELSHPTDPRYLLLLVDQEHLPEQITPGEAFEGKYGKLMIFPPGPVVMVYAQPNGVGTAWIRPS